MDFKVGCVSLFKDKLLVLKENKSKMIFENVNLKTLKKVKVDGCVIKEGQKCDYLVVEPKDKIEHFVELKGSDVKHAEKQLAATITQLSSNAKEKAKCAYVVTVKNPLIDSEIQRIKIRFRREFNSSFVVKNSPLVVEIR